MQVLQVQRPDDSDGGSRAEVSEPVDLHQVLPLVMNADAAVVLLTRNVLADPAVLLGLFWAVVKGVPLVPMTVHVRGQPKETQYDYHEAKEFLNALTLQLNPEAVAALKEARRARRPPDYTGEASLVEPSCLKAHRVLSCASIDETDS